MLIRGRPFLSEADVSCGPVKLSKIESITNQPNTHFDNDKDLEIIVVVSIQILRKKKMRKQQMRKRGHLVNESVNNHMTRQVFDSTFNSVIDFQ